MQNREGGERGRSGGGSEFQRSDSSPGSRPSSVLPDLLTSSPGQRQDKSTSEEVRHLRVFYFKRKKKYNSNIPIYILQQKHFSTIVCVTTKKKLSIKHFHFSIFNLIFSPQVISILLLLFLLDFIWRSFYLIYLLSHKRYMILKRFTRN